MRAIDADAFKDYIRGACEDMKHLFKDNADFAKLITESFCKDIDEQPTVSAEPHWIPVTKEEMFKAGYEGKEIRFRVDGRLFAIRELAQ